MNLFDVYPVQDVTITRAKGAYVWDDKDNQYLDLYGGHAVISIGHTHPHYVAALTEQLQKIGFYSNSIKMPLQEELAAKLGKVSGKEDYQLFLCNSGAEANENALKLASFHNGRKKIVAFKGAFHGRTSLAVAATNNPAIVAPVNETDNVTFLPFNDDAALEAHFSEHGNEISSVIIEGVCATSMVLFLSQTVCNVATAAADSFSRMITVACRQTFIQWQKAWAMVSRSVASSLRRTFSQNMACSAQRSAAIIWHVQRQLQYWM
jgi:acetylornithine/N-succinyldiaminopimelate aminotransferase